MTDRKEFNQLLFNSRLSADFELRVMRKIKRYRRQRRLTIALIALIVSGIVILRSTKNSRFSSEKNDYFTQTSELAQSNSRPKSYALEELHFVAVSGETSYLCEEHYLKQSDRDQL